LVTTVVGEHFANDAVHEQAAADDRVGCHVADCRQRRGAGLPIVRVRLASTLSRRTVRLVEFDSMKIDKHF
jgi:hypothetical protein